ncbi:MAG TPA: glutamyl-tRNA reductase [Thermoguttaceae bacterium]|nr:glutamyl-tRNA reductase [Thermoguttaceae bacterium]
MRLRVVGCSHHNAPIEIREPLAFDRQQARDAIDAWRTRYSDVEAVLLSTCNRVELYLAAESGEVPCKNAVAAFLADFHDLCPDETREHLVDLTDRDAIVHLFRVACSLDSMVVGEPQILAQVKQAYEAAVERDSVGTLLHEAFQGAIRVARRVDSETDIHRHHVSVPSVAVADFGKRIFQRFDDKKVLVIGAGEMADQTLRYLQHEGSREPAVLNRNPSKAEELARRWQGKALAWDRLDEALAAADVVVSTTGANEPIVTLARFHEIEKTRRSRPLFILDLAVPRDFEPAIGDRPDVYLYCIDNLEAACERNLLARWRHLPAAERIVQQEADDYFADARHRATGPMIESLRRGWQAPKQAELERLYKKLPQLDDQSRQEIDQAFDRLLNKLLHGPMESLRREARHGIPSALTDALVKLFHLKEKD